jgi:hypothetical protein
MIRNTGHDRAQMIGKDVQICFVEHTGKHLMIQPIGVVVSQALPQCAVGRP